MNNISTKFALGFTALSSLALSNHSFAWDSIVSCDHGLVEVDSYRAQGGYMLSQLVVRRELTQWALNDAGVSPKFVLNNQGELIFSNENSAPIQGYFSMFYGPSNQNGNISLDANHKVFSVEINGVTKSYNLNNCQY